MNAAWVLALAGLAFFVGGLLDVSSDSDASRDSRGHHRGKSRGGNRELHGAGEQLDGEEDVPDVGEGGGDRVRDGAGDDLPGEPDGGS